MERKLRGKRKEVIFTPEEWELVVQRAASVSLKPATFIRRISVNGSITVTDFSEMSRLLNGLRIIGSNINQLAKKANEINSIYAADYEKMKGDYESLCRYLNQSLSTHLSTSV